MQKKVFISHSSKDCEYVKSLVNLLEDIGLSTDEIVCSSVPEYGIPLGADIYDWLADQFKNFDLHVVFVLSNNYYDSVACLNEMGAAWVLKKKYYTVLLPNFEFQQIQGAINPRQISIKLDGERNELVQRLKELKDFLISEYNLKRLSDSAWKRYKDNFITNINSIRQSIQSVESEAQKRDERINNISNDAKALLISAVNDSTGNIMVMDALDGLYISTGKQTFISGSINARDEAHWRGVLRELEQSNLIQPRNTEHDNFYVTQEGYSFVDKIC